MEGEGFVIARTPPCWFSSKQQTGELLEADVPPGEAHLQAPQGAPRNEESEGKKE